MTVGLSLPNLFAELHRNVEHDLGALLAALAHPTDKGDAAEAVWIDLFNKYLPSRYHAIKAHVIDSQGRHSDQIDVVIHDRHYTPLIFTFKAAHVIPAESVYAVFEVKPKMNATTVRYAQDKVATVRNLHRTSLPVPTVDGTKGRKEPGRIIGGLLALSSEWSPPFGEPMQKLLESADVAEVLDIGCAADAGMFTRGEDSRYTLGATTKPVTRFLLELTARLQALATVPMIDIRSYMASLD